MSLDFLILESRVPVSEQIGTVAGLSMMAGASRLEVQDLVRPPAPLPPAPRPLVPAASAARPTNGIVPTSEIAVVSARSMPAPAPALPAPIQGQVSWSDGLENPWTEADQDLSFLGCEAAVQAAVQKAAVGSGVRSHCKPIKVSGTWA